MTFRNTIALAVACAPLVLCQEAEAYKLLRQKGWAKSRLPVPFVVNPNGIPYDGVETIKYGALMWSNKPQFEFAFEFKGTTSARPSSNPGSTHVVGMSNGLSMGVMAMTYFRFQGGYLNRFNIAYNARQRPSKTRFTNTVIHEFGHALGLGHSQYPQAVMEAGNGSGNRLTDLHQDDINGAIALYPPSGNRPDLLPSSIGTPEIVAPKGQASGARPAFQWTAVVGATGYEVALDRVEGGQQAQIARTGALGSTAWTPPQDLAPGRYFWWVRARKGDKTGTYAFAEFSVTQAAAPPATPQPQAPLATTGELRPTFRWSAVGGAREYELALDVLDAAGQQVNLQRVTVTQPTHAFDAPLEEGKTYRWWVRARDASGQTSDWGFGQFEVEGALGAPTLLAPSGTVGPDVAFRWSEVPGASGYELSVHRAEGGAMLQESVGQATHTAALPPGGYHWWVRATRGQEAGAWVAGAFTVGAPLGVPTIEAPSGTVSGASQTFRWSAVPGADAYELTVHRAAGGSVLAPTRASTPSHTLQLPAAGGYFWWVRAVRGSETGAWSSAGFTLQDPSLLRADAEGLIPSLEEGR